MLSTLTLLTTLLLAPLANAQAQSPAFVTPAVRAQRVEFHTFEIKAAKAKTKARRLVPLLPNLRAWLEPLRKTEGPLCCLPNLHFRLNYLGDKARIGWRQNALRHSYASYRLADTPDAARVALEMGNSPEKLFRHYRELVTPEAAKEWFSIRPAAAVDVAQVA